MIHIFRRTFSPITFLLLALVTLSVPSVLADECKQLSATGNSEYPPYLWRTDKESNELSGAISSIMEELGQRLNRDIELKHVGSWSRAQEEVKSGRVDLIAGAFYTEPRSRWMNYIRPAFLTTNSVVWIHSTSDVSFHGRSDLVDKLGVTVINNSFGQSFDEYAKNNLKIEYVASIEQAYKMLVLDRVDYLLYEKNPGLAYASKMGVSHQVSELLPSISSEGLYLTISHKSKCNTDQLRSELDRHLREMSEDGYTDKALQKSQQAWDEEARKIKWR